ncbi:hypothetical protein [Sorangium sp. So ce204]|uniref:hypothetical protein n=1 Tax=Sorangium sp. So ce204 TaxID=3133288 RepID=UPI003F626F68
MEDMLGAMWLVSPLGLAMIACVAIGFAVTAREALGRERGLREAREHAHEDEVSALTEAKEKAERERDSYRRLLGEPTTRREGSARPAAPPAPTSVPPSPLAIPPRAFDAPPPVVPSPERAAESPRAKLPPPPQLRLRSPLPARAGAGAEPARRAADLTSFPLQHEDGGESPARGSDWEDVERSPLNTTLPGVGSGG